MRRKVVVLKLLMMHENVLLFLIFIQKPVRTVRAADWDGEGGGGAAEAVQTKCLLSTPVSSSVLLFFFFFAKHRDTFVLLSRAWTDKVSSLEHQGSRLEKHG